MPRKILKKIQHSESANSDQAVIYFRVSSPDQEKEGFSIPAQRKLLNEYGHSSRLKIVEEFVDVDTAKKAEESPSMRWSSSSKKILQ
jgi:site-specific DNA recombinase